MKAGIGIKLLGNIVKKFIHLSNLYQTRSIGPDICITVTVSDWLFFGLAGPIYMEHF